MSATGQNNFWRKFGTHAETVKRQWPFDPYSYPIYAIIGGATAIELAVILATDFTCAPNEFLTIFYGSIFLAFAALVSRAYGLPRIARTLEAAALPLIIGGVTAVATILMSAIARPFADTTLAAADHAVGFDWVGFYRFNLRNPWLIALTRSAYNSIFLQSVLAPVLLSVILGRKRLWQFLTAWVVASAIAVVFHPLLPAEGPYHFYGISRGALPIPNFTTPWDYGPMIDGLRSGRLREISMALTGLVSFPSFHAASATLFVWAAWPVRWAAIPLLALNFTMIVGAVVIGGHYFIDIPGGIVAGFLSIWVAKRVIA